MSKENKPKSQDDAPVFTKQQFLASNQFSSVEKDALNALLQNGEYYTTEQVETIIHKFQKGLVK
ncbi:hypothetical protein [Paenibacillus hamazuiensis]|uniref:hypothetical protein n=1 Tax=Paenibacillus hamazuiensis TaxID=2936508 RepID=UPI00200E2BA7|nr:hypothetical protein [Paenibacillus hamazuiensis]